MAAESLDENRFIVADDELPTLSIYRLGGEREAAIPLPWPKEADLGGGTVSTAGSEHFRVVTP
jgi:hypothetical protein